MKDTKRIQKLVLKLLVVLCLDVFAIQPGLLAQSVVIALYSFIVGLFFAVPIHKIGSSGKSLSILSAPWLVC